MSAKYLVAGAVLLAGCGGGSSSDKPTAAGGSAAVKQEVRAVAQAYLRAVAHRNWQGVCKTRAASEVAQLTRTGGSCEKVFAALLGTQPVGVFKAARAADVRIADNLAGIDVKTPGQAKPVITLAAVRENGAWKLKDLPDGQVP